MGEFGPTSEERRVPSFGRVWPVYGFHGSRPGRQEHLSFLPAVCQIPDTVDNRRYENDATNGHRRIHRLRAYRARLGRRVRKHLRKMWRMQEAYGNAKERDMAPVAHAAPPKKERALSVQYLANQKPPDYLQSVFSI